MQKNVSERPKAGCAVDVAKERWLVESQRRSVKSRLVEGHHRDPELHSGSALPARSSGGPRTEVPTPVPFPEPAFESDQGLVRGLVIDSAGRGILKAFPVFGGFAPVPPKPCSIRTSCSSLLFHISLFSCL